MRISDWSSDVCSSDLLLRHDCAHVLAEAVQELYPGTQITFGPAIEDGFYYDFHRDAPFSTEDFPAIEARMREIVDRDERITREVWARDDAIPFFRDIGEPFKAEHVPTLPGEIGRARCRERVCQYVWFRVVAV